MITVAMIIFMQMLFSEHRRRWAALAVVCLGQLMMVVDATIVNVALPVIQRDLRFSQANLTWVVDAYMIAFGSFLLLAGRARRPRRPQARLPRRPRRLHRRLGALRPRRRRRSMLIAARFVQGLGGAIASSVILALIVTEFREPRERATAMSVYMFVVSSGGSLGLLVGGVAHRGARAGTGSSSSTSRSASAAFVLGRMLIEESPAPGLQRRHRLARRGADDRRDDARGLRDRQGRRLRLGLGAHARLRLGGRSRCSAPSSALEARLREPDLPARGSCACAA